MRCRRAFGVVSVVASLGAGLVAAPGAAARSSQWAADWVANSGGETLESGQVADAFVRAKNVGTATWFQGTVKLGTVNFPDQSQGGNGPSPFGIYSGPDAWLHSGRAATTAEQSVPQGGLANFNFKIRAPEVKSEEVIRQYFAPLAEFIEWMYGCPPNGNWCGVYIFYTVRPQQSPTVRITSVPARVERGEPIIVEADATDNVAVRRVVFSLGGSEIIDETPPFRAEFASSDLDPSGYVVTARAYDVIDLNGSDVRSFVVAAAPTPPPPLELEPLVADAFFEYSPTRRGKKLAGVLPRKLSVKAPAGSSVEVRCPRKRCRTRRIASTKRKLTVISGWHNGKVMPAGTKIEILINKAGTRGLRVVYTVLKGKHSKTSEPILPAVQVR